MTWEREIKGKEKKEKKKINVRDVEKYVPSSVV